MLDEEFNEQRARTVRDLAEKAADPFIKRRLLGLVARYEDDDFKTASTLAPMTYSSKVAAPAQKNKCPKVKK